MTEFYKSFHEASVGRHFWLSKQPQLQPWLHKNSKQDKQLSFHKDSSP